MRLRTWHGYINTVDDDIMSALTLTAEFQDLQSFNLMLTTVISLFEY